MGQESTFQMRERVVIGQTPDMQRTADRWCREEPVLTGVLLPNMLFLTTCLAYGIPLKEGGEKTDEEVDGPYSDDEMLTHKGLRRSQSMKSVKTVKGRKEVSQVLSCFF